MAASQWQLLRRHGMVGILEKEGLEVARFLGGRGLLEGGGWTTGGEGAVAVAKQHGATGRGRGRRGSPTCRDCAAALVLSRKAVFPIVIHLE